MESGLHRTQNVGVNTTTIAKSTGVNNNFASKVKFAIGQAGYGRTVLSLTDHTNLDRFDIPEEFVSK